MLRFIQKKKQNKCFGVFFIPQRGNLHNFNDEVCVGLCKDSTYEGAAPHKATRKIVKKKTKERKVGSGGRSWVLVSEVKSTSQLTFYYFILVRVVLERSINRCALTNRTKASV